MTPRSDKADLPQRLAGSPENRFWGYGRQLADSSHNRLCPSTRLKRHSGWKRVKPLKASEAQLGKGVLLGEIDGPGR